MPVLKTYINGKWENVSGFESNADTLDGKHASEFAAVSDVEDLQTKVGDKSVSEQISEAVANIEVSDEIYVQNDEPADAEDGSLWVDLDEESGASENSPSVELDTTLTKEGYAADAKAVGDALAELNNINHPVDSVNGKTGEVVLTASDIGAAESAHEQSAGTISEGTFAGKVQGNTTAMEALAEAQFRDVTISATDLTAGTSSFATGTQYLVYE